MVTVTALLQDYGQEVGLLDLGLDTTEQRGTNGYITVCSGMGLSVLVEPPAITVQDTHPQGLW